MQHRVDHVVLTNVSAPLVAGEPAPDPEELWYRLGFFVDAALPSVSRQQNADVTWLAWFDDRCDQDYRDEVERLSREGFIPIWGHQAFGAPSVASTVAEHTGSAYLITTLLERDDAMARDCLATVNAELTGVEGTLVTFSKGFVIDRTGGVFKARDDRGPVRSFVERRNPDSPPTTIVGVSERDVRTHRRVTTPMWIDVVHEPGRTESVTSRRVHPGVVADRFDIDLGYDRALSGPSLRRARVADLRRLGRNLAREPRTGSLITPGARTMRSASWMTRSAVNTAADRLARRRSTAGLHVVAGDPESLIQGERVAVLAEFSGEDRIRPWALVMAESLGAAGYPCLVVASRNGGRRVRAPEGLSNNVAIVSRANVKYDFGAWAAALEAYPQIARAAHVLLTNDSIVGPLAPEAQALRAILDRAESSGAQVWAATRSLTGAEHLGSFFLTFHAGTLALAPVRDFFRRLRHTADRGDLVRTYEHGLSRLLAAESIGMDWGWDHASFGYGPSVNPPLCWRDLLESGFPFVKRRLLVHPRFVDERPALMAHVRDTYGVDLSSGL